MIKRILPIILCFVLAFSITAFATENTTNQAPPQAENMPTPPEVQGGERRGGMDMPPNVNMGNGEAPSMPDREMTQEATPPTDNGQQQNVVNNTEPQQETQEEVNQPQGEIPNNMPQGGMPNSMQNWQENEQTETGFVGFVKTYSTPITSVILLIIAFVFVHFYKRKKY